MLRWLDQRKKIVLSIILILLVLLAVFYSFIIRPLAAEEVNRQDELKRIKDDISFYTQAQNKLKPQDLTDEDQALLMGSIPDKSNVEEIIRDLEKTELETGVVIENISSTLYPNGMLKEDEQNTNKDEKKQEAENSNKQPSKGNWEDILPKKVQDKLKDKMADVNNLTISYVDLVIDVNGEADNVHKFVKQIENFNRIIHVQSYDYKIIEEKDNRLEGKVTIRAFYCENFKNVIKGDSNFKLDYQFDPNKLKRYIEPLTETESTGESDTINTNTTNLQETSLSTNDQYYNTHEQKDSGSKIKDSLFYVVQSGAYKSMGILDLAVKNLIDAGVFPRVVGNGMKYIYVAVDSDEDNANKIMEKMKDNGIDSYVKTLPYGLTNDEEKVLLTQSEDLLSAITKVISNGITQKNYSIPVESLDKIHLSRQAYENKLQVLLKSNISKERQKELAGTLTILDQVENILQKSKTDRKLESLWETEGLILDFMLILNGYAPYA